MSPSLHSTLSLSVPSRTGSPPLARRKSFPRTRSLFLALACRESLVPSLSSLPRPAVILPLPVSLHLACREASLIRDTLP